MRIVGGKLRGRPLLAPKDLSIRPTADRIRESIFNILEHGIESFEIESARVIDLFAGTGAMGLEALSRGASFCLFVDDSAEARGLIRSNAESLGLTGQTRLYRRDATHLGPTSAGIFDLAFLDPPYGKRLAETALVELCDGGWLSAGAVIAVEEEVDAFKDVPTGYDLADRRRYGGTEITFLRSLGRGDAE
ncbi:MAG: 16S rRNA (guanine(966)-N(2))-methyltransferase RsmD [Hyphomicrobiaceae bacterium]